MPTIRTVASSKGASLATEAWGELEKGTILLVMGATASMLWWPDELMKALADCGYQVIRFDHRDTGQSATLLPGEINYDLADMSGDLIAILDAYEVGSAHIVGMSLGGLLGQIVALQHPERVKSLTLIASEPVNLAYEGEGIGPEFMAHFKAMAALDWSNRKAVSDFLLRSAELSAGSAVPFDAEGARQRVEAGLGRTDSMASAFNHGRIGGNLDGLDLAKLTQPVLVIHGSEDPIIPIGAGYKIAETAPDADLMVLDRRGHEILERDVPAIAAAILALADGA
ncbi:Pimeloyl-ACP methyl ester carboxylesterase [Devosia sp. YR412]|nr:Pimeloyl-ACP methyl ester carboxylesterase [Devosia sp. YR412]